MIDNKQLLEILEQKKRLAEIYMRSANLNGDVKCIHKFCEALHISTAIYNDIVKKGLPVFSAETAIKILENWKNLKDIKPSEKPSQPNFQAMARISAQGAGEIK